MVQARHPHGSRPPRLLDQVREVIRMKRYSIRTEEAYVPWIKRFVLFHDKRHPRDMGPEEVRQFLTHLAVTRRVSASTQNQALSAILFVYKAVLQQDIGWIDEIVWAKKPKRLPVVLTREEVKAVLQHLSGQTWLMAHRPEAKR